MKENLPRIHLKDNFAIATAVTAIAFSLSLLLYLIITIFFVPMNTRYDAFGIILFDEFLLLTMLI